MKIIIFGASGGTGRHLLEKALNQGHEVTAFCRSPEKLLKQYEHLRVVKGDALDERCVTEAILGQDVVVCVLGMPDIRDKSQLRTKATQIIIHAMQQRGITRLICLSAFGAGDSVRFMPLHYRYLLVPIFMKALYDDHNGQEAAVMASTLNWTLIRPTLLHDGAGKSSYLHGTGPLKTSRLKIARADVADFMLCQLNDTAYIRQAPCISG